MDAAANDDERTRDIADGLRRVRGRIGEAARRAGRDADDVTLIVVTKTYPADDVMRLAHLGVHDVGENRDQEAAPKAAAVEAALHQPGIGWPGIRWPSIHWHFVGQLQTNKARSVVRYAHAIHSVDRVDLVTALNRAAARAQRQPQCFVQVSLDGDTARGGAAGDDVLVVADAVAAGDHLGLAGLMAVAPLDWEPARAFDALAGLSVRLRAAHPAATGLSAGMSGDFEAAIEAGATHVRVGSAVLGQRAPLG